MNNSTEKGGSEVSEAPKCRAVPMNTAGKGDEQKIWYDHLVAVESGGCAPPVYVKEAQWQEAVGKRNTRGRR